MRPLSRLSQEYSRARRIERLIVRRIMWRWKLGRPGFSLAIPGAQSRSWRRGTPSGWTTRRCVITSCACHAWRQLMPLPVNWSRHAQPLRRPWHLPMGLGRAAWLARSTWFIVGLAGGGRSRRRQPAKEFEGARRFVYTGTRSELMDQLLPTTTTADEKKRDAKCAVLPVGSFEQHGDYLPLVTDTVIAAVISRELSSAYPLLQLPPVTISCSHEHSEWSGTVSISSSTLHSMVNDIYCSIASSGLTALRPELPWGQLCPGQCRPGRKRPGEENGPFPVRNGLGASPTVRGACHIGP